MMSFARKLATSGQFIRSRAGPMMSSRHFWKGASFEQSERNHKILLNLSAGLGCISAITGFLGGASYYVIAAVNDGLDEKLQFEKESTLAKLESEKIRNQEFQSLATKTHLDTVRRIDETVADLRSQFNNLYIRCIEWQSLQEFYRSQVLKAQEVLEREGVTGSAELHAQIIPKISELQAQIDVLTKEVTMLRLQVQGSATGKDERIGGPIAVQDDVKGSLAGKNDKSGGPTGLHHAGPDVKSIKSENGVPGSSPH